MKATPFILLCGIGLVGCSSTSEESETGSTPANSSYSSQETTTTNDVNVPGDTTVTQDMSSTATTQPNNSGINTRDREPGAVTAGTQGQSSSDVSITANIRKGVLKFNDLSVNARNVKIITVNGYVTLRGPVMSEYEKDQIGTVAANAVGWSNVNNQLEVQP